MDTAFTVFSSSDCAHVRRVCTVCARACGARARRQPVTEAACRAMQRDHDEDPDEDRQREVSVRRPPEGWDGHPNRRTDRSAICAPLFSRNAREASHGAGHRFKLEDPVRAVVERLADTIRALIPPRLLSAALLLHLPQPEARRCAVHSSAVVREIMPIEEARRVRVIDRRVVAVVPVRER